MHALGRHVLVDFYGCDLTTLNDVDRIEQVMREAAAISGATIVQSVFHRFSPHGVSGTVVIAESHLAIHTWPECGYAAVDLFTCGDSVDPWTAFEHLRKELGGDRFTTAELRRGVMAFESKTFRHEAQPVASALSM